MTTTLLKKKGGSLQTSILSVIEGYPYVKRLTYENTMHTVGFVILQKYRSCNSDCSKDQSGSELHQDMIMFKGRENIAPLSL